MPRPLASALLTAATGTLLLTGCGDDSSSPDGDGADAGGFCADALAVFGRLSGAFEAVDGQSLDASVPVLDQAVAAFDELDPPAEIGDDWQTVRGGFADLRDAVYGIDTSAPDAEAQAEAAVQDVEAEISPSLERVDAYYSENCETGDTPAG